jgi:hypothetical protein
LETESNRRREEKIKAGKLITLGLMVGEGDDIEARKAARLAQHLREHPEDAEKEVVWGPIYIIRTGVRRSKHFGNWSTPKRHGAQRTDTDEPLLTLVHQAKPATRGPK